MGTAQGALPRRRSAVSSEQALAFLRGLERSYKVKIVALLGLGIPACFLGPLLVAAIIWMVRAARYAPPPFWPTFQVACYWVIPLMFVIALATRSSLLEEMMEDDDDVTAGPMGYGARGRAAAGLFLLDVLLYANRAVISAFERLRARGRLGSVDLPRVADALVVLAAAEGGILPASLLAPGEPAEALDGLLPFLFLHELIGVSKAGDKVWLASDARRRLIPERRL